MREIRHHGQERRYHHTRLGINGRMDTIQCAVLLAKLDRFDWEIERRLSIGRRYDELLAGLEPAVRPVKVRPDRTSVYAQYTIVCDERDALAKALGREGIPTAVHYPVALHQQPAYAALFEGEDYPVSEALARGVLSLPMHPYLDEGTQTRIAQTMRAQASRA